LENEKCLLQKYVLYEMNNTPLYYIGVSKTKDTVVMVGDDNDERKHIPVYNLKIHRIYAQWFPQNDYIKRICETNLQEDKEKEYLRCQLSKANNELFLARQTIATYNIRLQEQEEQLKRNVEEITNITEKTETFFKKKYDKTAKDIKDQYDNIITRKDELLKKERETNIQLYNRCKTLTERETEHNKRVKDLEAKYSEDIKKYKDAIDHQKMVHKTNLSTMRKQTEYIEKQDERISQLQKSVKKNAETNKMLLQEVSRLTTLWSEREMENTKKEKEIKRLKESEKEIESKTKELRNTKEVLKDKEKRLQAIESENIDLKSQIDSLTLSGIVRDY